MRSPLRTLARVLTGRPADLVLRVEIENYYPMTGSCITQNATLTLPMPPEGYRPTDRATHSWERVWIYPTTGTGRTRAAALYTIKVRGTSANEIVPLGHTWTI